MSIHLLTFPFPLYSSMCSTWGRGSIREITRKRTLWRRIGSSMRCGRGGIRSFP